MTPTPHGEMLGRPKQSNDVCTRAYHGDDRGNHENCADHEVIPRLAHVKKAHCSYICGEKPGVNGLNNKKVRRRESAPGRLYSPMDRTHALVAVSDDH